MQRLARPIVLLKEAEHNPCLFPPLQPEGRLGRSLRRVVNDLAEARDCRPTSCNPLPTNALWRFGATADQRRSACSFQQHVGMSPRHRRRVIPEGCHYELAIPRLLLPGRGLHRTRNRASVPRDALASLAEANARRRVFGP